jgi:hypothetical protein
MSLNNTAQQPVPMRTLPAERRVLPASTKDRLELLEKKVTFLEEALKRLVVGFPAFEPDGSRIEGVVQEWGEIEVPAFLSDPEARAFRALASDFGHEVALASALKSHKKGVQNDL